MGIDLRWESERGEPLNKVPDPHFYLNLALSLAPLDKTVCLRFIDPYGYTVFNQQQIPVLISELQWLLQFATPEIVENLKFKPFQIYSMQTGLVEERVPERKFPPAEVSEHIHKILELANQSKGQTHTYLRFCGD